jgi:beta-glucosidase
MASFDDLGLVAKSCNVLEKGTYRIYVGNSVRDAKEIDYTYEIAEDVITEQLHSYCAPERLGKRMIADGTYVDVPDCKVERTNFPCTYKLADVPEEPITLLDVAEKGASLDAFIAQLTTEEMIHLVKGVPSIGVSCTSGFGSIEERHIPPVMTIDGPAGVRIDRRCEVNCTAWPVATALACTWNLELMEEIGRAGALEAKENNLQIWLTPALNIHRSPLCGRNFEYFSEDPFVSGKMAAASIRGIESQGIAATAKHLACNNKETNRKSSDSIVSERAIREIYLKGFEICVKEAQPQLVMSSYNLLNGIYTSANQELLEGILRREWGFKGMVVSDWTNKADHVEEIKAGNDVRMPKGDAQYLLDAVAEGRLTREELAVCVKRLMKLILWIGEEDGLDKQGVADTDDFDPWAV